MASKHYEVVRTYDGRWSHVETAGRFSSLRQAIKERDRQNAKDELVWHDADSVLNNTRYARTRSAYEVSNQSLTIWRVWDHAIRSYAD